MTNASADDKPDLASTARRHLTQDAAGPVRVIADRSGRVAFVGTSGLVGKATKAYYG